MNISIGLVLFLQQILVLKSLNIKKARILEDTVSGTSLPLYALIIIAVGGVVILAVVAFLIFRCIKNKKAANLQNDQKVNIKISENGQKDNIKPKPFIENSSARSSDYFNDKTNGDSKLNMINNNLNESNNIDLNVSRNDPKTNEERKYTSNKKIQQATKIELDFKKTIDKIDTKDDKIIQLIISSQIKAKENRFSISSNNNGRGSFQAQEINETEKAIKDIVTKGIDLYTEGARQENVTEGSQNPYFNSVQGSQEESIIQNSIESYNEDDDKKEENCEEHITSNNKYNNSNNKELSTTNSIFVKDQHSNNNLLQVDTTNYGSTGKKKQYIGANQKNQRGSIDMTPEEHSDFLDDKDSVEEHEEDENADDNSSVYNTDSNKIWE